MNQLISPALRRFTWEYGRRLGLMAGFSMGLLVDGHSGQDVARELSDSAAEVVKDGCNPLPLACQHLPNRGRRNGARTGGDRRSMLRGEGRRRPCLRTVRDFP